MPSKPGTEPTLEELSAYLDHELDAPDQARVAEHIATCADCQSRLDDLRQTVYAVRGLPQETPPRRFTIPAARPTRALNWAPIGWIGGVAAAMLFVIVGVTQLHFPGGGATLSPSSGSSNYAAQGPAPQNRGAAAPNASGADKSVFAQQGTAAFPNSATVTDPSNSNRKLVLGTDVNFYAPNDTIHLRVILQGGPSISTDAQAQGLSVVLTRSGYGVVLRNLTGERAYGGPPTFDATEAIANLPQPAPGFYTLVATWTIPDGSGRVLQATVAFTINGG